MIVADTSFVYALLDASDSNHSSAADWYISELPTLTTTPLVIAEIDHLAGARAGKAAQNAFRADLASGAYDIAWWADATSEMVAIADRYRDLDIGLADASLVALAARIQGVEIATYDQRHFRAVRPLHGEAFRLMPLDA